MADEESERIQHSRKWNDIPMYCPVPRCDAVIHRYDMDTGARGNWLLSFCCEDNHHWVVEVSEHSGIIASEVRQTSCPGAEHCYYAVAE